MKGKEALDYMFSRVTFLAPTCMEERTKDYEAVLALRKELEVFAILEKLKLEFYKNAGDDIWNWIVNNKLSMKLTEKEVRFLKGWLNDK